MQKKRFLILFVVLMLVFSGCRKTSEEPSLPVYNPTAETDNEPIVNQTEDSDPQPSEDPPVEQEPEISQLPKEPEYEPLEIDRSVQGIRSRLENMTTSEWVRTDLDITDSEITADCDNGNLVRLNIIEKQIVSIDYELSKDIKGDDIITEGLKFLSTYIGRDLTDEEKTEFETYMSDQFISPNNSPSKYYHKRGLDIYLMYMGDHYMFECN